MVHPKIQNKITDKIELLKGVGKVRNPKVLLNMLGPIVRGFVLEVGKQGDSTNVKTACTAHFRWDYQRDKPELQRLYSAAKKAQWDADTALDWSIDVDPYNPETDLLPEQFLPIAEFSAYRTLSDKRKRHQRKEIMAWMLSQFLHGEQGALFAACQVTESVEWFDGKLYGSTQVVDEGRHVEVFSRYLLEKLEHLYQINDNLYVIIDSLMRDRRWDMKFLGMQIMVEGLALGAFGTLRQASQEPLLRELLKNVITDEARHVHYGVVALQDLYTNELTEFERREREDWAYEVSVLLRDRFLAHEFYDEYWAHALSRKEWDRMVLDSPFMHMFRQTLFRRIIPNLKRINLLSSRIRPHYEKLGVLKWAGGKAAPDLTVKELIEPSLN
jgi:hypothetical protein